MVKTSRCLKKEDQECGLKIVELARKHSSEAFYALDDPFGAARLSVLVTFEKDRCECEPTVPTTENVQNEGIEVEKNHTPLRDIFVDLV